MYISRFSFLFLLVFIQGCYSFKGFSIDPNVKSFYVTSFENKAVLAPASLAQEFTEKLRNRVRDEARLKYDDTNPDLEFSGTIKDYAITVEAPKPGEGASINVLTMIVSVEHTNHKNEKASYKKDFPFQVRFDGSTNIVSIQNDLNKQLNTQIVNDIINATFNNW